MSRDAAAALWVELDDRPEIVPRPAEMRERLGRVCCPARLFVKALRLGEERVGAGRLRRDSSSRKKLGEGCARRR